MTWHYSNTTLETTLTSSVNAVVGTINVAATTGHPVSFPYTLVIDHDQSTKEIVSVTSAVGLALAVTRGVDGTSASSHNAGASVIHAVVARDLAEPQAHIAASDDVHGVGAPSDVVGTATSQTLTNKTINGSNNTLSNVPSTAVVGNIPASQISGNFDRLDVVTSGSNYVTVDVADSSASRTQHYVDIRNTNSNKGVIVGDDMVVTVDDTDVVIDTRRGLAASATVARLYVKNASKPAIVVDRPSADTANLQEWRANGTAVATLDKDAKFASRGTVVTQIAADTTTLLAKWQNSSPTTVASVSYLGDITGHDATFSGAAAITGNTSVTGNLTVSGIGQRLFLKKSADQIVNNSSTLVNDNTLLFTSVANATYRFFLHAIVNSGTTPDFKEAFSLPASATCDGASFSAPLAAGVGHGGVAVANGAVNGIDGIGADNPFDMWGIIVTAATPGACTWQWAQNTANPSDTTVKGSVSWLEVWRVA